MIRYSGSSKHAGSRGKPVATIFPKGGEASATMLSPSFSNFLYLHRVYILVAGTMIFLLVLGCVLVFLLKPFKPPPDLFPPLCRGNFQSAHLAAVPTPATSTSPSGDPIGLSEGANIFDLHRPNQQEVQHKLQAAQAATTNDFQNVVSSLEKAISSDQTDAEAQIYLENWRVLGSNHPHITLVVGVDFASPYPVGARSTLQGAFTAQKECNNQNNQDSSKTQIVLMIANIGGNNPNDRANSAKIVANQIADQAVQDTTIVGIMGWSSSPDTINVNHQLKTKGSTLPMVSSSSSGDELGGMSNFFRVCPTDTKEAQVAANFLLKTKHKKRIAILYDNQTASYSNNLERDFAANISASNIVGLKDYTGDDAKTVQDALNNVLAHKPDALFFAGYANNLVELLNDISSTSSANLLIVGGDDLASTNVYQRPPPNQLYFTTFSSPNEWDGTNPKPPFLQDYKTNFGTDQVPTGLSSIDEDVMLSYDAMLALLHSSQQVLSAKNTINASDLIQALKQITGTNAIQGITGRIAFDSSGNQDSNKMIFVEHIEGTNLVIDEKQGCLLKDKCGS